MKTFVDMEPERAVAPASRVDRIAIGLATAADREVIYGIRHEVYAVELGQHPVHVPPRLEDALDAWNCYLVARAGGKILGFVSITPPRQPSYSIDKYWRREELPFKVDEQLHEIRLLTVNHGHRGRDLAAALMYAAFRWVEAQGGTHLVAIGRQEILDLYLKSGLQRMHRTARSGRVTYELLHARMSRLREQLRDRPGLLERLRREVDWELDFPFASPVGCFHGGAFFTAIGPRFDHLERAAEVINADVLDAWFPPAPGVTSTLQAHLPWLVRTSPPADCGGFLDVLAQRRGLPRETLLPGAGSSDLIFRAFREWLTASSRVLLLDPTYGEYAHVLTEVIGCRVDRLRLSAASDFAVDPEALRSAVRGGYDLIVLVNPNSPTGRHLDRDTLMGVLSAVSSATRVWVDETYVDYLGDGHSLECFAAQTKNVLVCKSMSKVYALSGLRVAYLCAGPHHLERLRSVTPPWAVSLPAQVAAVRALEDPGYYAARYRETAVLRERLAGDLRALGWRVLPGCANFLLCELPSAGPTAHELTTQCQERGLFLRDAGRMGTALGTRMIRIAVKDGKTNERMVEILRGR